MIVENSLPAEETDPEQWGENECDDNQWTFPFSDWTFRKCEIECG